MPDDKKHDAEQPLPSSSQPEENAESSDPFVAEMNKRRAEREAREHPTVTAAGALPQFKVKVPTSAPPAELVKKVKPVAPPPKKGMIAFMLKHHVAGSVRMAKILLFLLVLAGLAVIALLDVPRPTPGDSVTPDEIQQTIQQMSKHVSP